MQKILMLGTGCGFVHECYETCFLFQNDDKYFMIDTGGSADVVKQLKQLNIGVNEIHDIFISHSHTDHILGLFWLMKRITGMYKKDKYIGKLNIYCNDEVANAIKAIYPHLFPDVNVKLIDEYANIIILNDGDKLKIANREYTFFDVKASKNKLFGIETILDNNERLVFLGDETLNPELYYKVDNAGYVMHEAFCLDKEQDIFKPYEKKHSTVMSVCKNMNNRNIKNLILFHTEDTHLSNRKELYINEAKRYFDNNILVPDDLEIINIC